MHGASPGGSLAGDWVWRLADRLASFFVFVGLLVGEGHGLCGFRIWQATPYPVTLMFDP